jgi:hypothetical protein
MATNDEPEYEGMKLDRTKPFGQVYGHENAQFFQNGVYFDGTETALESPDDGKEIIQPVKKATKPTNDGLENAKTFLTNILKEGPISKSAVFQAAGQNNQKWDQVQEAASQMGIVAQKAPGKGNQPMMWKLPERLY